MLLLSSGERTSDIGSDVSVQFRVQQSAELGWQRQLATDPRKSRHLTFSATPELPSCVLSDLTNFLAHFGSRKLERSAHWTSTGSLFLAERNAL